MSEQASLVQEGIDRFQSAVDTIDRDFRKFQKNLSGQRKDFEKRTRKRLDQTFADVRKQPAYQRADDLRKDAAKRLEQGFERTLDALGVASRSEVQRLDRKLSQLAKKLRELEKGPEPLA